MFETLTDWKESVRELNSNQSDLDKIRQTAMDEMDKSLDKLFAENGLKIDWTDWEDDLSVIDVHLVGDTTRVIPFTKRFLVEIGMPFTVVRQLTKLAEQELYIKLYPLLEED